MESLLACHGGEFRRHSSNDHRFSPCRTRCLAHSRNILGRYLSISVSFVFCVSGSLSNLNLEYSVTAAGHILFPVS